jgi:hypothetical protein
VSLRAVFLRCDLPDRRYYDFFLYGLGGLSTTVSFGEDSWELLLLGGIGEIGWRSIGYILTFVSI